MCFSLGRSSNQATFVSAVSREHMVEKRGKGLGLFIEKQGCALPTYDGNGRHEDDVLDSGKRVSARFRSH